MLLEMKHISKDFSGVQALKDVNLGLEAGEVRGLVGENGAGKSTLIKLLTGVYRLREGTVLWGWAGRLPHLPGGESGAGHPCHPSGPDADSHVRRN